MNAFSFRLSHLKFLATEKTVCFVVRSKRYGMRWKAGDRSRAQTLQTRAGVGERSSNINSKEVNALRGQDKLKQRRRDAFF